MPAPRATPTPIQSLMRWLAAWLAIALCAQALSSGSALIGTSHRHTPLAIDARPMIVWRHGEWHASRDAAAAHARAHRDGAAHHHAMDDASLLPTGADAAAAALAALVAAPAPRGDAVMAHAPARLHDVWASGARWTPTARAIAPPQRPPRTMR